MTRETTYNGWTNYATWRVNLEICDDEIDQMATDRDLTFDDTYDLSKYLENHVEEIVLDGIDGFTADYASAFLSDVNYYEIAEHAIADFPHLVESSKG